MSTASAAAAKAKPKKRSKTEIKIRVEFCKGCGICVAFCPTKVLAMRDGKVVVAEPDKCIACMFCELRCPDFAIAVFPEEE